eukprot:6746535-Prymnesium_polylepis.1
MSSDHRPPSTRSASPLSWRVPTSSHRSAALASAALASAALASAALASAPLACLEAGARIATTSRRMSAYDWRGAGGHGGVGAWERARGRTGRG